MTPQIPDPAEQRVETEPALQTPFWDYVDLGLFISLFLPSLVLAALLVKIASKIVPLGKPLQALVGQLIAYVFIFGSLYGLLHLRYRRSFWRSLGWKFPFHGVAASFFGGPLLAIAISFIGYKLQAPEIPNPFQQMLQDRPTVIAFAIFVVVIGPLCEELAFRGFLMPLLMRTLGVVFGIVLTGALFGCLHGYELSWSWRHMLLIATAGTVFGWVKYKTGSTAAAVFMHSTYNLTQFAAFLLQNRTV